MKELTNAEEQVMQILWELDKAFVKDIIERMEEPKPAYNTVSTIIRILEKKGFADHTAYGNTHQYFPIIKKEEYSNKLLKRYVKNYFSNSYQNLVSFFADRENLTIRELEELKEIFELEIKKQQE